MATRNCILATGWEPLGHETPTLCCGPTGVRRPAYAPPSTVHKPSRTISRSLRRCRLAQMLMASIYIKRENRSTARLPGKHSTASGRNPNHNSRKKRKKAKKGTPCKACSRHCHFCVFFRSFRLYPLLAPFGLLVRKTRCCAFAVQRHLTRRVARPIPAFAGMTSPPRRRGLFDRARMRDCGPAAAS